MVTDRLLELADRAVKLAAKQSVDHAQASVFIHDTGLTRYANSQIHQNVAVKNGGLLIKAIIDNQIATIRINTLEEKQVEKAVVQAAKTARSSRRNRDFKSLPDPEPWIPIESGFNAETAECSPQQRAEKVKEAVETAHSRSPKIKAVAGYISTTSVAYAVANSLGVSAAAKLSTAAMKTTAISRSGSSEGFGTAEKYSRHVKNIEPSLLANEASEKAIRSLNPVKLPPGEYQVVLSPLALATLLTYMGYIGFSATPYQEGRSFVKYHLNDQVFDEKLDVKDDARDPETLYATPFDGEGVPKRPLQLIEKGAVNEGSICHNSFTAGKENKKSTGHAVPPISEFFTERPIPFNVTVSPCDSTLEEEIIETKEGIFVTTFHYVNPVEPTKVILTGLTRDGTFLIDKGEISRPIMNLRFTDSILSAFKSIPLISRKRETIQYTTVPSVKLEKLRFVGVSSLS